MSDRENQLEAENVQLRALLRVADASLRHILGEARSWTRTYTEEVPSTVSAGHAWHSDDGTMVCTRCGVMQDQAVRACPGPTHDKASTASGGTRETGPGGPEGTPVAGSSPVPVPSTTVDAAADLPSVVRCEVAGCKERYSVTFVGESGDVRMCKSHAEPRLTRDGNDEVSPRPSHNRADSTTQVGASSSPDVTHDPYIPAFKRALSALALELPGPVYDDFKERALAVVEAYERLAAGSATYALNESDLDAIRDLLRYLGTTPDWGKGRFDPLSYADYKRVWEAGRAALTKLEKATVSQNHAEETR